MLTPYKHFDYLSFASKCEVVRICMVPDTRAPEIQLKSTSHSVHCTCLLLHNRLHTNKTYFQEVNIKFYHRTQVMHCLICFLDLSYDNTTFAYYYSCNIVRPRLRKSPFSCKSQLVLRYALP